MADVEEAGGAEIRRLTGYDDHAEYELDLQGLDKLHAEESVKRMIERSRFQAPRSVIVRLTPAEPGGGETLFQPIGRQLLAARKAGHLAKLAPLPIDAGSGYYLVTAGKASDEKEVDEGSEN